MKRNVTLGLLALAVLVGAWWYVSRSGTAREGTGETLVASSSLSSVLDPASLANAAPPPAGYAKYTNAKYGFSLYHPEGAKVREYDEGGGASTITLEDVQEARGLQIFIVPYSGDKISEERFRADVPSGVRTDVQNTFVGGAEAVTFVSSDQLLGKTREVWFIRGGYLYEVTTFEGAGDWLTPIMQSWTFLSVEDGV